jgi:CheY-like chemotaxis protein
MEINNQIPRLSKQIYSWRSSTPSYSHISTSTLKLKTSKFFVWVTGRTVLTVNESSVEEILIPEADQIVYCRKQRFLYWRHQMIPAYQVSELLSYINPNLVGNSQETLSMVFFENGAPQPILVLSLGSQIFALEPEIDSLVTDPELVIQPLKVENGLPNYVYGSTIWKDRLLQVIDVASLYTQTVAQSQTEVPKLVDTAFSNRQITILPITKTTEPIVLVVDDSNSIREILSLTLQKVGYQVLQAQDGQEAITKLQQNSKVQLVICDIEMPNLNGFEFLSHRCKDPHLAKIPVVMLSTCSSNKHRVLAMQLGATAYFTKPYIEPEFLASIQDIIKSVNC